MAESISLARPYAKAAFRTALESKTLVDWSKHLALLSTFVENSDLQRTLSHPGLTSNQKAQVLISICDDSLSVELQNFITVLAENNRLLLIPDVATMYEELKSAEEATMDVAVETAMRLTADQKKRLMESLNKKLERTINLKSSVNKQLIGGVVIRAGDLVIDASIRGRLTKLAEKVESKLG